MKGSDAKLTERSSVVDPRTPFTIRWVLAHEPASVFEKASKRFGELLAEETRGGIGVRVMTASEYGGGTPATAPQVVSDLLNGKLEMTQTYSPLLGHHAMDLWALDLPFLFRDHAHAAKVLDGPIGEKLMRGLLRFRVRGLAFTYSGGYRFVATKDREIHRWEDLKGLKIRTSPSPVAIKVLESLGAEPVPSRADSIAGLVEKGLIDSAETTYPRYLALGHQQSLRIINETSHSLFLTVVAVHERFFQSLPKPFQATLESAAKRVAVMEREQSICDGEKARRDALQQGVKIVTMSEPERRRFEEKALEISQRFVPLFGGDLLDAIRDK